MITGAMVCRNLIKVGEGVLDSGADHLRGAPRDRGRNQRSEAPHQPTTVSARTITLAPGDGDLRSDHGRGRRTNDIITTLCRQHSDHRGAIPTTKSLWIRQNQPSPARLSPCTIVHKHRIIVANISHCQSLRRISRIGDSRPTTWGHAGCTPRGQEHTMTRTALRAARLGFAALLIGAGTAAAQTKVYPWPGDPSWSPWTVAGGTAQITGANPNHGNGSLSLGTTSGLFDWGFYLHTSGEESWGKLGDISALSFEWYRTSVTPTDPNLPYIPSWPDAPWMAQTPVLRLLLGQTIGDQLVMSELVWEKWYTDGSPTTQRHLGPGRPDGPAVLAQHRWRPVLGEQRVRGAGRAVHSGWPESAPGLGRRPAPRHAERLGQRVVRRHPGDRTPAPRPGST